MKQNMLLEDINKKMERKSYSSARELEDKVDELKKKTKLKMKLMKQDQKIQLLTQSQMLNMRAPSDILSQSILAQNLYRTNSNNSILPSLIATKRIIS